MKLNRLLQRQSNIKVKDAQLKLAGANSRASAASFREISFPQFTLPLLDGQRRHSLFGTREFGRSVRHPDNICVGNRPNRGAKLTHGSSLSSVF
jgi:hypothetical protein